VYDGGGIRGWKNVIGESDERNWLDIGVVATGVSGIAGSSVRLADLNGDGVLDYLPISSSGAIQAWIHHGEPRKGDGIAFADLDGDSRDDLSWISKDGEVQAWLNGGLTDKDWRPLGTIAKLDGVPRSQLRFADVNGDSKADLLRVYNGGTVVGYINNGALGASSPSFDDKGVLAAGVGASVGGSSSGSSGSSSGGSSGGSGGSSSGGMFLAQLPTD